MSDKAIDVIARQLSMSGYDNGRPYGKLATDIISALKAERIAIVELPPHDSDRYEGDEHEPRDRLCWMPGDDFEVSVWYHSEVQRRGYGWGDLEPLSVADARSIAAALLAAANAAELA
ncbi:hypothetical protein [Mycobacterium avium]|uniref:hypothetical protein n=1 Tax=Mycobacterium avium TaxID=1764 RepID=UPI001023F8D7|nr:hypothetical protein [Mycobacterium avium]QBC87364.1 hypothetical protein B6K05_023340 [Mycobacterium avium subsp. hominissuis]